MTRVGYLLPTREQIIAGRPEARSLLELADRAERVGLDSVWVGDSLLARPRHEPLALLAAVAGRVNRCQLGTAVLLPALRNPVLLAHQVATLDQLCEGRLILGVGIARDVPSIRAEFAAAGVPFERRVGRMLEGLSLCRALWSGKPVEWNGRWTLNDSVLAPIPHRPGGPPLWIAGSLPASLERAANHFDGWLPNAGDPTQWREQWATIKLIAKTGGRSPDALTGAMYLTITVDENAADAEARLNAYLEQYYGIPAATARARQACFAGSAAGATEWLQGYAAAGVEHMVVRCVGDQERHLELLAAIRSQLAT